MERPWELDPVPLLIAANEWRELEAGLIQRAKLLNQILDDCYGPQKLILQLASAGDGFGQPDFLRPCHGIQPKHGKFLIFMPPIFAFARWTLVIFRPHPNSHRHRLCAGEPASHRAHPARAVPRQSGSSPRWFLPGCAKSARGTRAPDWQKVRIVCSRPGLTTKPISNRPISRATLATYSSRARI